MWKIQLFELNYDFREAEAVSRVVDSGWLTMGENTKTFEYTFAQYLGREVHCAAVSSGTAALHLALLALDICAGDEVIIPGLTFVADANVVKMVGATPVLADSASYDDWNISVDTIKQKVSNRTKALIVVHYAGYPCDMTPILDYCRSRGIFVIEDAAHAPGAMYKDSKCGTIGDIGCFSFFSNKNLSVGEGGMVATSNPRLLERIRHIRSHGMTSLTLDRHKGRSISYDVVLPGLNYRIDEIRAALGLVQLSKLDSANANRKVLTERYRANLLESRVTIPFSSLDYYFLSSFHILPVLLPKGADRLSAIEHLKNRGIQSSIHYPSFSSFTAYRDMFRVSDAALAFDISSRVLTLPLFPSLSEESVDTVTRAVLEVVG